MPAHKKPKHVLEMNGAFAKDPKRGRARENEPEPTKPLGDPPSHLSENEAACWYEIVESACDGVLFASDRFTLEVASKLMSEFRHGADIRSGTVGHLIKSLGLLGLSPQDRMKLQVQPTDKKKDDDPWAAL